MVTKTFSDYECMYFDKIGNKTFSELIDNLRSSDLERYSKTYRGERYIAELNDLANAIHMDFFRFALKEQGFLDIPIIVGMHYKDICDHDIFSLFVEYTPRSNYKTINFDVTINYCYFAFLEYPHPSQIIDLEGCKTIGDFINYLPDEFKPIHSMCA